MYLKKVGLTLALAGLLAGAAWAQNPAAAGNDEKAMLTGFVSKLFSVERNTVNVTEIKPSALIKGAREATVTIGGSSVTVFLVGDKLIVGNTYDKNFDPLKALMARMTLKGRPTKGKGPVTIVEFSEFQ
jgi:protein-disulfide isomerase